MFQRDLEKVQGRSKATQCWREDRDHGLSFPLVPACSCRVGHSYSPCSGKPLKLHRFPTLPISFLLLHDVIPGPHPPGWLCKQTLKHHAGTRPGNVALMRPQTGWIKQQKCVSSSLGDWKSQVQALASGFLLSPPTSASSLLLPRGVLSAHEYAPRLSAPKLLPVRMPAGLG